MKGRGGRTAEEGAGNNGKLKGGRTAGRRRGVRTAEDRRKGPEPPGRRGVEARIAGDRGGPNRRGRGRPEPPRTAVVHPTNNSRAGFSIPAPWSSVVQTSSMNETRCYFGVEPVMEDFCGSGTTTPD